MPSSREQRRAEQFKERQLLLGRQKKFANEMLRRWLPVESELMRKTAEVVRRLTLARDSSSATEALEIERSRLSSLLDDVRDEIQRWNDAEETRMSAAGRKSASDGTRAAAKQLTLAAGFGSLNAAASERIVQRFDSVPLTRRHATAGQEAKEAVRQAIFSAVSQGENPRTINTRVMNALDSSRDYADTLARTWIVSAHRDAGIEYYRSQGDLVKGWEWLCAKNLRTCPLCLARDGTVWPVDSEFVSHPRCRCTTIPVLEDEYDEIPQETGQEYFDRLSPEQRAVIVGPTKARLIADGKLKLEDLVMFRNDPDYGMYIAERSIRSLISRGTITQEDFLSARARRRVYDEPLPPETAAPPAAVDGPDWTGRIERLYGGTEYWDLELEGMGEPYGILGEYGITSEDFARMVAAPHESIVTVYNSTAAAKIIVEDRARGLYMERTLYPDGTISHDEFRIDNVDGSVAKAGDGAIIFSRAVENYLQAGLARIETVAVRGKGYNGYYTWARFGFDGIAGPGGDYVQDIMARPNGAAYWKENGETFEGEFEIDEDSRSMRVLREYVKNRRKT